MSVTIRKFRKEDIPNKVTWVNDPANNYFLHYDLPLEIHKTEKWFENIKDKTNRYDAVIEYNELPVGLIGLLNIDPENLKAEYYILMGEDKYKNKGMATRASELILDYGFSQLGLNKIYLYTETENIAAQRLFETVGFKREGYLSNDLIISNKPIDRYLYSIVKSSYFSEESTFEKKHNSFNLNTPIYFLDQINSNQLFIKRDDLIPYSFGGNKVRKALNFFKEIDLGNYRSVVTYGSSSSNHCRIIANLCAERAIDCYIVSSKEQKIKTANSQLVELSKAIYVFSPLDRISETIDNILADLEKTGAKPYFIPGGGHGNLGTKAYIDCYQEIRAFQNQAQLNFDYIFLASGTGASQAGLICGKLVNKGKENIIGISIARENPRGRDVVISSINSYFQSAGLNIDKTQIDKATIFNTDYLALGYGHTNSQINQTIKNIWLKHGIPLDSTYTGKAFTGMLDYLEMNQIKDSKLLFIHTGGSPLFFDDLEKLSE